MTIRAYVTFQDALTPVVDVSDDDSPPPGRALADELVRGLQAKRLVLTRPVSQWETYGWEFTVTADGRNVWFMLQASDEWLVMSNVPRRFIEKIRGVSVEEQHKKALGALASVLAQARFTNVTWFTKADFESRQGGADAPTP